MYYIKKAIPKISITGKKKRKKKLLRYKSSKVLGKAKIVVPFKFFEIQLLF